MAQDRYRCSNPTCRQISRVPGRCSVCDSRVVHLDATAEVPSKEVIPSDKLSARPETEPEPIERSWAWAFYAMIACAIIIIAIIHPNGHFLGSLLVATPVALYARYIYRGGSIVIIPIPSLWVILLLIAGGILLLASTIGKVFH